MAHFQNECKEKFNKVSLESHNNLPAFKLLNQSAIVEVPIDVNKAIGSVLIAFWLNKTVQCWDIVAVNISGVFWVFSRFLFCRNME
jgi:hypothetical protein